jgi:hypothetical protein
LKSWLAQGLDRIDTGVRGVVVPAGRLGEQQHAELFGAGRARGEHAEQDQQQ